MVSETWLQSLFLSLFLSISLILISLAHQLDGLLYANPKFPKRNSF